ncbi:MAG: UPF0175 family protein [Candidatus Bathyarchaeia archaeon]
MTETRDLTVRVDKETYVEIEQEAEQENVDKSTAARGLLKMGLRMARKRRALKMYRAGSCSMWKAAEVAGVSLREMMDLLEEKRIPLRITPEDVDEAWREALEEEMLRTAKRLDLGKNPRCEV